MTEFVTAFELPDNQKKIKDSFLNFMKFRRYQLGDIAIGDTGYGNALYTAFREGFLLSEKMKGNNINIFGDPYDNVNSPQECLLIAESL